MPTLRDYELAFQQDPTQQEPFLALRKAYREDKAFDRLVTLYETRGQALTDLVKAAELFYWAAELRADQLGDVAGAEVDLVHALDRDPANGKAAQRLKLIYREQGRTADYLTMMEMEAAAVARTKDQARVADLHAEMNQLFAGHFARIEKAITGPQRATEVTPDMLRTIESARKIYRALGDWPTVVRLYDLELLATTDGKRRADLQLASGRVLAEKLGQLEGAVERLTEVARLRPRDDKALEALALIFTSPQWTEATGRERAAAIYHQIARRRFEAGDVDGAVAMLRKALAAVPRHAETAELLERILYSSGKLQDLDLYYRERAAEADSVEEKMDFLFKRAQLAERDLEDRAEALRVYEEIARIETPGGPASQHLVGLYTASKNYGKLAELRERELAALTDPEKRLSIMRELAALYRDRLGDPEQAAVHLHGILQIAPTDEEALDAYAAHFRDRNDWPSLIELLEFSFDNMRAAGVPAERLLPRLEEIAVLAERHLNDPERALTAWQRIEQLEPQYERAREAQKRLLQKARAWDRMAAVLTRELQAATDPAHRLEAQKRLARLYLEKLEDWARAVAVYREILAADPADNVSFRAIVEILEREQQWEELAGTLRAQIAVVGKAEAVSLLRRLMALYDETLARPEDTIWAASTLLTLVPGDREALVKLAQVLEASGDKARLADVLEQHIAHASAEERPALLQRAATLRQVELGQPERAIAHWEALVEEVPGDGAALDALGEAYQQIGRPDDLARVLDLQIARLRPDPATQAEYLRRLARLAQDPLEQKARARRAWEDLLEILPSAGEALEALTGLYRDFEDYAALVEILARRVALAATPEAAAELALERASLIEVQLGDERQAIAALEQLIAEVDPRHAEAHARLRALAERRGDWARVVKVAERQLALLPEGTGKIDAARDIGFLLRDRLKDPGRAIAAFERVLELAPGDEESLAALSGLYAETGDYEKLVATDELRLAATEATGDRRQLMFEIADAYETSLGEPRRAFEWSRRAHAEQPDDETMGRLEALAGRHGLWDELIRVYESAVARTTELDAQLALIRKIARICEEELHDGRRAFSVLRDALAAEPDGETLLPQLERLAELVGDHNGLLDAYARVAHGRTSTEERVDLLARRATIREQKLRDPSGALDEHLRAFALLPESETTQLHILRLAEITNRWEDAISMQAQLFARAFDVTEKVEVARVAASLVEEKLRDRVRAFHAYLNAFRLAPDDAEIIGHLWRLARSIGRYDTAAAPAAARPAEVVRAAEAPAESEAEALSPDASTEALEALDIEDLEEGEGEGDADVAVEDGDDLDNPGTPMPALHVLAGFATPWEEFAQAYALLPANDNATRREHLLKIADIWENGAEDVARALEAFARAFRLDPGDIDVRDHLVRLAQTHSAWDQVCDIYLSAIDSSTSRELAVELHHEVAKFREALGQRDKAEERYRAILKLTPDDRLALDQLEDILRVTERWDELAGLLNRRISGTSELVPPGRERRRRAFELAELYDHRLDRPYEAIDAYESCVAQVGDDERGADDPTVMEETRRALDALARLYAQVERWPKVVEVLSRAAEITSDPQRLRELHLRLAEIAERQLVSPAQAIASYEAVLAVAPDDDQALAALERLLEAQSRWEDLDAVLARRVLKLHAQQARRAEVHALVTRRARILEERLGNPDGAATALRTLGTEALEDDAVAAALMRNLRSAGLVHEAVRVLEQQAELAKRQHADPERLVRLHLELARVRSEDEGDLAGARAAIEAALAEAPDHVDALAALAGLELKNNNFAAYARTKVRQAGRLHGPAAAAALLEAAKVFRDQLGEAEQALAAFDGALEAEPDNTEALRGLAALLNEQGRPAEARELLERQLVAAESPLARAVLLTDLARVVWEKPGDGDKVLPYLDEAVELEPDYLPAVLALADVLWREQQWSEAERRLPPLLRRWKGDVVALAPLHHRLGEVYDRLGRLEEGYRHLQEADKLVPGQLLVRLALADNRYTARKWRDAVAHLEGIEQHPEARSFPDEVARGLDQGGQAELKLKRGDRAEAFFKAALALVPDHHASLKALAELAVDRGEREQAASYLRRLAEVSTDSIERAGVLEQLGDVSVALGDAAAGRVAYEAAIESLPALGEPHLSLLSKTLNLQRAAGATAAAADTLARLIALENDPVERGELRREAAIELLEHGETSKAAELLVLAVQDNPQDEVALGKLVDAAVAGGSEARLAAVLAPLLTALPPPGEKPADKARRADLWLRFATLETGRDPQAAINALEHVVALDPEHADARAALVALYDGSDAYRDAALRNHRALVQQNITRASSLRALARAYAAEGRIDEVRCCCEVLEVLGLAQAEDRAFLESHAPPPMGADDPYPSALDESQRTHLLAPPELQAVAPLFAAIWEGVPDLVGPSLAELGVESQDKVSPVADHDLAKIYSQVGKALGNQKTTLYLNPNPSGTEVAIAVTHPPSVVVPAHFAADFPASELRFRLGRALELARPELILAATMPPAELTQLLGSLLRAFFPRHARRRADSASEQAAKLKKALPYKVSKRLAELFGELHTTPFSSARWRRLARESANRAGLLAAGDLTVAVRVLTSEGVGRPLDDVTTEDVRAMAAMPGAVRDLLRYAVSEEYFTLRSRFGTAVDKAA